MAMILTSTALFSKTPPLGTLVYCSYSSKASAGGSDEYCEMINENDETKVVCVSNLDSRFEKPQKREFKATKKDAGELKKADNKQ